MVRRTLYLPALLLGTLAAAVVACAVALLAVSSEGKATSPGKNGRIAYASIAYASGDQSEPYFGPIYTIKPGGSGKSKVTNGLAPSYSPDGKRIAYATLHNKGNDADIYTIDVGGGGKSKVTTGGPPSYSPDGKRLVFSDLDKTSSKHPGDYEIYTVDARGGDKTQVTNTDNAYEFDPSYSPDGKKIAYTAYNKGNAGSDIYTINVGGEGKFRVTHTKKKEEAEPSWGSRP